jgi:hypothetical protein
MLCAFAALVANALTPSAAIQMGSLVMAIPLLDRLGFLETLPADTSHSNFRDGMEAQDAIRERQGEAATHPGRTS